VSRPTFIPALRFHALTRFYDELLARTMREVALKRRLIAQAALEPGMRVLDLGCGTATLSVLIKQTHPDVDIH
jgi:ubiquinone/menaquinone biosynthesis C-methylase UbiE